MSRWRNRLALVLGSGVNPAEVEQLTRRLDELDAHAAAERERHEALVRELATDLTERLAAIERRLAALEARDQ